MPPLEIGGGILTAPQSSPGATPPGGTEQTYADHRPLLGSGDTNWARVVRQSVEDGIGERGIAGDHAPMLDGNRRGSGGADRKVFQVGGPVNRDVTANNGSLAPQRFG